MTEDGNQWQWNRPHSIVVRASTGIVGGWGSIPNRLTPKDVKIDRLRFSACTKDVMFLDNLRDFVLRSLANLLGVVAKFILANKDVLLDIYHA